MTGEFILVSIILIAGFTLLAFLIMRNQKKDGGTESMIMLQNQLAELGRTVDSRIGESTRSMQTQTSEIAHSMQRVIRDITEQLTRVDEGQKQVRGFADEMKNLQQILQNPKQRGVLGEYYLETLLQNVLAPGSFQMQYPFKDGTIVDAVIFVKDKIIPIDSKFSLENYNRIVAETDALERERLEKVFKQDLKNRIDETSKYVKPDEGTMDFAFMFIPAEGIYYDLLINQVGAVKTNTKDLIEYAFKEKHVIIVSPTSFLAYLQTVLQGLRALQIEESAKEIRKGVEELSKHWKNYEVYMGKLGNQLGTAVNSYNAAHKELKKVDKDVLKLTGKSMGVDPILLDRPEMEEAE